MTMPLSIPFTLILMARGGWLRQESMLPYLLEPQLLLTMGANLALAR